MEAFARALGADPAAGVPPTYAAVYALGTTAPQLFEDEEAAVDLGNLLHVEQEFVWERHPRVGETVRATGRVVSDHDRRGLRLISFETTVTAGGSRLCRSLARFAVRSGGGGGGLEEAPLRPAPSASTPSGATAPPPPAGGGGLGHLPQRVEEGWNELVVTFTREQIAAYADASGDHNPIHLDDDFARSVGLPGIIAHGMLQMGLLARVAGPAGELRRLSCRFAGMVRPGDTVTFRGQKQDGEVQLTAVNQDGQPVLSKATAELR